MDRGIHETTLIVIVLTFSVIKVANALSITIKHNLSSFRCKNSSYFSLMVDHIKPDFGLCLHFCHIFFSDVDPCSKVFQSSKAYTGNNWLLPFVTL